MKILLPPSSHRSALRHGAFLITLLFGSVLLGLTDLTRHSMGAEESLRAPALAVLAPPIVGVTSPAEAVALARLPEAAATVTPTPSPTVAAADPGPEPRPGPGETPAAEAAAEVTAGPTLETPAAALRLWSNGDSTSYFMSVWLADLMTQKGAILTQPQPEYKNSSGLITTSFFDWPAYLQSEMAAKQPNLVVFMIGANDARLGISIEDYRARVAAVMDGLYSPGRRVVWVGQPNMGRLDLAAAIPGVNGIFQAEAAKRPWITYVDTWTVTSDAAGNYQQYLPDETGILRQVRADDGVHFTHEGGRRIALAVIAALPAR